MLFMTFARQLLSTLASSLRFRWPPLGGLVVLAFILAGCGHKPTAATAPPKVSSDQADPPATAPGQPAPAPVAVAAPVPADPDGGADMRALNHAYIGWIVANRRRPRDFDDFATSSGIQIPPAPAGKKYIIDKSGFIALANQ